MFEYFPAFHDQIRNAFPTIRAIASCFNSTFSVDEHPCLLPHDLRDSFAGAAWRYPERYLDQGFRDGTSAFRLMDPATTDRCLSRWSEDLESGQWDQRYSEIRRITEYDHGYLFILANRERGLENRLPTRPELT